MRDKSTVVIAFTPLPSVRRRFSEALDATFLDEPRSARAVLSALSGAECLIVANSLRLDREFLMALPDNVRLIGTYSVGTDHIDLAAAALRGVPVLNTPDVLTDAVAEIGLFLLLGAARRATESLSLLRSGSWSGWTPTQLAGVQLSGRRLGIFGMGRIGRAVAQRARAFGMSVHYTNRRRLSTEQEAGARYHATLHGLLKESDCLMLCCPAAPDTIGAIDADALALLPRGAILINIARGNVVNDQALISALQSGHLLAAGLDVFNNEPHLDPRYQQLPNVFMTPHIGSSTLEAREMMAEALIEGIKRWVGGLVPANRVI